MRFYLSSFVLVLSIALFGGEVSPGVAQERSAIPAKVEASGQKHNLIKKIKADMLFQKAYQLYKTGQSEIQRDSFTQDEDAQKILEEALKIYTEIEDKAGQAFTLRQLAIIHRQTRSSIEYLDKSLEKFKEINDRNNINESLYLLGILYGEIYDSRDRNKSASLDLKNSIFYIKEALTFFKANNNIAGEARALMSLSILMMVSEPGSKHALLYAEKSVQLARNNSIESETKIQALITLAIIFEHTHSNHEITPLLQEALLISRKSNSIANEIILLNAIGNIQSKNHEYDQSNKSYDQIISICIRSHPDRFCNKYSRREGLSIFFDHKLNSSFRLLQGIEFLQGSQVIIDQLYEKQGMNLYLQGRYEDALKKYQKAEDLNSELNKHKLNFYHLSKYSNSNNQGWIYLKLGKYNEALKKFEQVPQQEPEFDNNQLMRKYGRMNFIGACGGYGDTIDSSIIVDSQDFYSLSTSGEDCPMSVGLSIIGQSEAYKGLGNLFMALRINGAALRWFGNEERKDESDFHKLQRAIIFNNRGSIYRELKQYNNAVTAYKKSINFFKNLNKHHGEAVVLNNLGEIYNKQGSYSQALEVYEKSLAFFRNKNNPKEEASILHNIGSTYYSLGRYNDALNNYKVAIEIRSKIKDYKGLGASFNGLGLIDKNFQNYSSALLNYEKSLSFYKEVRDLAGEAVVLNNIGLLYREMKLFQQGLQSVQKSLVIFRELKDVDAESNVLDSLGTLYKDLGYIDESRQLYQQSIFIAQKIGNRPTEAQAYANLALLFNKQNQPQIAIAFYKKSVSLYEDIRKGLTPLPKDQQQSYTNTVAQTYRDLADLLLKNDRILEARQVIELLRLQELDNFTQDSRGKLAALTFLQPELELLKTFNAQEVGIVKADQELRDLRTISQTDRTPAQKKRITELEQLQKANREQTRQFITNPNTQALIQQLKIDGKVIEIKDEEVQKIQGNLKTLRDSQQEAALISPMIFDDRLEILVITPTTTFRRTVPNSGRTALNPLIAKFAALLSDPSTDPKLIAQQLYQALIAPLETDLKQAKINTLIYSPDQRLRSIPINALHDGEQWLTQRFQISYLTSTSTLDFTTPRTAPPKVLAGTISEDPSKQYDINLNNNALSFRGLPGGKLEVNSIKSIFPTAKTLIEQEFSSTSIRESSEQFNMLHFATHGFFDINSPQQSFILLGSQNAQGSQYATLTDFKDWQLSGIDLVTLSACETAIAAEKLDYKLGIMGLGYQFEIAGARATLASLWKVNDLATTILMKSFYTHLSQNKTKSEALRLAQIDLLKITDRPAQDKAIDDLTRFVITIKSPQPTTAPKSPIALGYSHPYYWAPFILIGNGR